MKKYKNYLISFILILSAFYLSGVLMEANFNPFSWNPDIRKILWGIEIGVTLITWMAIAMDNSNTSKK